MKVLLVNKFHYLKGGSETYYFALADAIEANGMEVVCFATQHERNLPCPQENYFIREVDFFEKASILSKSKKVFSSLYSMEAKRKFELLVQNEQPDIVHLNLFHRQITVSILDICSKYNLPVVFTAHDLSCICPNGKLYDSCDNLCFSCFQGHFKKCIEKRCVRNSFAMSVVAYLESSFIKLGNYYNKIDMVIAPSQFVENVIRRSGNLKRPITHLTNFLPVETRYECILSHDRYFLFLGSLTKDKGVLTLLKAFHEANLDFKLVFAGTGSLLHEMKRYIESNGLAGKVILTGYIIGSQLENTIKNAYAVVMPSEWNENCPYALMEPMAKGKPVIGANIGGIPELIQNGQNGYEFESGNVKELSKILRQMTMLSPEEYHLMCQNAVDFAKTHFDAIEYMKHLVAIYNEMIQNHSNTKGKHV